MRLTTRHAGAGARAHLRDEQLEGPRGGSVGGEGVVRVPDVMRQ